MNERIEQLADQAKDWAYADHDGYTAQMLFEQKFAELIVAECIGIVEGQKESLCDDENAWSDRDYGYEEAVNDSVDMIKKHFGVEE